MFTHEAKVQVKNGKGEVIASQVYQKVVFHGTARNDKGDVVSTVKDEELLGSALAFFQKEAGEKGNGLIELLDAATYAYDLSRRATIRQSLVTAMEGPEKAIEKTIKDMMAMRAAAGKPISEDVARQKVMALMAD